VEFLQWALPRLGLRWPGFRKVRRQVRKRIDRRLGELALARICNYRDYLETYPAEWSLLDGFCRISISRFYRDRDVFDSLRDEVLPELARTTRQRSEHQVRAWCAGCASGEEPYTLAILWARHIQTDFSEMQLRLIATDVDEQLLQRARRASYPASSLKDVPANWRQTAFRPVEDQYALLPEFQGMVEFRQQDVRSEAPSETFHLVLCRNLAFTYFAEELQRKVLWRLVEHIMPGGFLVIGKQEVVPEGVPGLRPYRRRLGIYRPLGIPA
jgi:chemotaxis protein methyltransferase CheR